MSSLDLLRDLMKEMLSRNASDLHIRSGHPPMFRILGELESTRYSQPLTTEQTREMASVIMNDTQRRRFEDRMEADVALSLAGFGRFRANIYRQMGGINMALRYVPTTIPSLEELNLPATVKKLASRSRGLILVTGVTGSGKSTTLAAIVEYINQTRKAHIITIEDPIEFLHQDKKSIISQRELGIDTSSYAEALKHVVRQDPDVILLGEMRDLETMAAAITSAQTGHLVLSTLHTVDAVQTVSRIVDVFPPHQQNQIRLQLADTLQGVVSQRLLRRVDMAGRIPAIEVLVSTALIKKAILENNLTDVSNAVREGQYYGMQTFNQALISHFNAGTIRLEDALAAASNPEELLLAVRGIEPGAEVNISP